MAIIWKCEGERTEEKGEGGEERSLSMERKNERKEGDI